MLISVEKNVNNLKKATIIALYGFLIFVYNYLN